MLGLDFEHGGLPMRGIVSTHQIAQVERKVVSLSCHKIRFLDCWKVDFHFHARTVH